MLIVVLAESFKTWLIAMQFGQSPGIVGPEGCDWLGIGACKTRIAAQQLSGAFRCKAAIVPPSAALAVRQTHKTCVIAKAMSKGNGTMRRSENIYASLYPEIEAM